jgi:hypothetical protein
MRVVVVACPVCGQRLGSTEAACYECGAVLALRVPDDARRRLAAAVRPHIDAARLWLAEAVRPHIDTARRGFAETVRPRVDRLYGGARSIVALVLATLTERRRTGLAVAALVITLAIFAVLVAAVFGPRTPSPPAIPRPSLGLQTPVAPAVVITAVGAIVATIAVVSRRRRVTRLPWIANSAAVAAAFCFGLAVALLVIAAVEHQRIFASAVPATGSEQSRDALRREASTLKEAPTLNEPRAASVTPAPSQYEAVGKPSTADILRTHATPMKLEERVWGDIVRDWERLKRTVWDLVRSN